jgi:transposase-like protein
VVIGAKREGQKVVLAVDSRLRESRESWAAVLRNLTVRGVKPARMMVAAGHLEIWAALPELWL